MKNIDYISAGAGSGKTTEIVNRMVTEIQSGVQPGQIIMTTFTKAAAGEIRERARKKLMDAGLTKEASMIDSATIGTIHAVCLRFIEKYWALLGISPECKLLEDSDRDLLRDQSLCKIVTQADVQFFEEQLRFFGFTTSEDNVYGQDHDYWRSALNEIISKAYYYNVTNFADSRNKSLAELSILTTSTPDINKFKDLVDTITPKLVRQNTDKSKKKLKALQALVSGKFCLSDYSDLETGFGGRKKEDKVDEDTTNETLELARQITFNETKTRLEGLINKAFDIAELWLNDYNNYKKQHEVIDYNDMEILFDTLLDNEEVQSELMSAYKVVFVDEFQDCNAIQIDIFKKLSDIILKSVWVGDPKQSIYGFRGSDIKLIGETRNELIKLESAGTYGISTKTKLDKSYRSCEKLVNYVNGLFLPPFQNMGLTDSEIVLTPTIKDTPDACIKVWDLDGEKQDDKISSLVSGIHKLIESGIAKKDIAVLVNTNSTAEKICDKLVDANVPAYAVCGKMENSIEIQALFAMLQYLDTLELRNRLKADLVHLFRGIPTEEIINDYMSNADNADWKCEDSLIAELNGLISDGLGYNTSMSVKVKTLIDRCHLLDIVDMWGNGDQRRSNLYMAQEIAGKFDRHCEFSGEETSVQNLFEFMVESKTKEVIDLNADTVKVLTYHNSKGLQWRVVIMAEFKNPADNLPYGGVNEQKIDSGYYVRYVPAIKWDVVNDIADTSFIKSQTDVAKLETTRLMYVGMTRAKEQLYFADTKGEYKAIDFMTDGHKSFSDLEHIKMTSSTESRPETEYYEIPDFGKIKNDNVKEGIGGRLVTPSGKAQDKDVTYDVSDIDKVSCDKQDETRMATIGTCIHNIYAVCKPNDNENIRKAETLIKAFSLDGTLNAENVVNAIEKLFCFLKSNYGEAVSIEHEIPFSSWNDSMQLVRGEIDMLWETNDGVVLVDFKNRASEEINPEHYIGQMMAYKAVIEKSGKHLLGVILHYATAGKIVSLKID